MTRTLPPILILLSALAWGRPASAQEAIYVVRHAERADQTADSGLSTKGVGRAYRLRDMLHDAGITQIFTSEFKRTIETAAPIASERHLTSQPIAANDADALLSRIMRAGARDRVLVVGHSNTVPALLNALHVDPPVSIAEDAYDDLFIVVPQKESRPVLIRLKF